MKQILAFPFFLFPLSFLSAAVCSFGPADSGKVVEGRVFSGGVELTDWKDRGDGVWECPVNHRFVQLFVDGRRAPRSPFPKDGFFHIGKATSVTNAAAGGFVERSVFTNDEIRATLGKLSAAEVATVQYTLIHKWACERRTLSSYDAAANATIALSQRPRPSWYKLESASNRSRVRFENVRTAFTEKGDWYYDDAAKKALYRPRDGEALGKVRFVAPKEEIVVDIRGEAARPVENLRFRNCTFEASKLADEDKTDAFPQTYGFQAAQGMTGAVELKYARNVTFENCIFRNTGGYGLRMREGCFSNTVFNCTLEDLGAGGIWAGPEKANPQYSMPAAMRKWSNKLSEEYRPEVFDYSADAVAFITVTNSTIRGTGKTNAEGVGVCFTHVSDSKIVHCDIYDLLYSGVSLGWTWGFYGSVAQRNEVAFCHIHDLGKGIMADMGGVYTLGTSHGTRIHDNVIHNVKSSSYGGWATYNDEGSEGVSWYNNLCYDCSSDLYHQHYGRHNTVRNSIFIADRNGDIAVTLPSKTMSVHFDANIFVSRGAGNAIRTDKPDSHTSQGTDGAVFTRNLWYKTDGPLYFGRFNEFWNWQHHGRDFDGAVGDPKFVDLEKGDYRLRPDSPALKLGFRPFDYTQAGRKGTGADKAADLIFHMDLNTIQMRRPLVSQLLKEVADAGYTHVLWEIEDKVVFDACPEAAHPEAFTKDEFRKILAEAKALGLKNMPLLQTFGHAEYILRLEKYRPLRELDSSTDCYCVSKPGTRELLRKLIVEYLELFGGKEMGYFHMGGDECYDFCKCPVCAKRNAMELYAEHLNALVGPIRELGVRPCIWNDMLVKPQWEKDIDSIPKDFVIFHWDYYLGNRSNPIKWRDKLQYLIDHGFTCAFAAASACGGDDPFLPGLEFHRQNIDAGWAEVKKHNLVALCVTSWSVRQNSKELQLPLIRYAGKRVWTLGPEYDDLARWKPDLCGLDGRGWHRYKDATVPPPGELDRIMKEIDTAKKDIFGDPLKEDGATYRQRLIDIATGLREGVQKALPKVSGRWKEAGELKLRLLDTILATLRGEKAGAVPLEETVRYFGNEQTPRSARNSAKIVWGLYR